MSKSKSKDSNSKGSNNPNKWRDLWKRVNFRYRVTSMNENTLEEIWKIRVSIFEGVLFCLAFALVLITLTSVMIIATPIRYYLPGYLDSEVREKAMDAAIAIDSLEKRVGYQDAYIRNLQDIFAGVRDVESAKILDTIVISGDDPKLKKSEREEEFTQRYAEDEKYNLSVLVNEIDAPMSGVTFYKPFPGYVIEKFDPSKGMNGVKLTASARQTVSAGLDGSVMNVSHSATGGYILQIQHNNGFVSIYRGCTQVLKREGDKVKTGEAVAIVESVGGEEKEEKEKKEKKDISKRGTYVVVELWFKGKPVNPEIYIFF